jgi:uridine kinase
VAIDGVDGFGKSTFVDQLSASLRAVGRAVVRVSVDNFHYPRAVHC